MATAADPGSSLFIEQIAVLLETDGLPRVAGRLFGLLLVTEELRSLDDLAEQLGVTKASISVNARLLEQKGVVERVSMPGDRRDYYRIADDIVERAMQQRLARIRQFRNALQTVVRGKSLPKGIVLKRLKGMDDAFRFLLESTDRALTEWRAATSKR